jgi:hypothetical protein
MLLSNPIWVIKTRTMLYLNERSTKISGFQLTKETVAEMWNKEGI